MTQELQPEPKRRRSFWRMVLTLFVYTWVAIAVMALAAGGVAFVLYDQVVQPGVPGVKVTVTIPEGATGRKAGEILAQAGLLQHEGFFRLALKIDGTDKPIRHGVYELPKGLSALELLHRLYEGPARTENQNAFKLTVPEGLPLPQIAALTPDPGAFLKAAAAKPLLGRMDAGAKTLDGYLMPNTFFFDKQPSSEEILERMLDQFEKEYAALTAQYPPPKGFDRNAIVTIASLVEEEAKTKDERPIVASVIYNRLAAGMPLQLDSTLQFCLGKYGQRMLDADKDVDSPYNTYKNAGLPPGPISSPGSDCLRAALHPAQTEYRYFVSNADGTTHTFSATLTEHEQAVGRFRREIREQRREEANKQPQ